MRSPAILLAASLTLLGCKKPDAPAESAAPKAASGERLPYVDIANYTGSAVTLRLNGELVGTWEKGGQRVDLPKAKRGENALEVEAAPPAKGDLRVYVKYTVPKDAYSTTTDELLKLDLGGKPGKHAAVFNWK